VEAAPKASKKRFQRGSRHDSEDRDEEVGRQGHRQVISLRDSQFCEGSAPPLPAPAWPGLFFFHLGGAPPRPGFFKSCRQKKKPTEAGLEVERSWESALFRPQQVGSASPHIELKVTPAQAWASAEGSLLNCPGSSAVVPGLLGDWPQSTK